MTASKQTKEICQVFASFYLDRLIDSFMHNFQEQLINHSIMKLQ